MDNYGITDAKFKVGVLADESSSSGGYVYEYNNKICDCWYIGENCTPGKTIILFGKFYGLVDAYGEYYIKVPGSAIACLPDGESPCLNIDCRIAGASDVRYQD